MVTFPREFSAYAESYTVIDRRTFAVIESGLCQVCFCYLRILNGAAAMTHDFKNRANAQNSNRWTSAGLPLAWLVVAFTIAAVMLGALNFYGV